MKIKLIFTLFLLNFLLIGCKEAYIQQDIFHNNTKAALDVASVARGENPMKRPSYEEYIESIETNPKQELFENYRQQSN